MITEIINTGSELMLGHILNSHQQFLCRQLADRGFIVTRQIAVADRAEDIEQAVRESLARADIIITTGGLGPTSDDLTRDLIAKLLGKQLRENREVLGRLEAFFKVRNRPMPPSCRVQALVPEGASVLTNDFGTAPGLAMTLAPNPYRASGQTSHLFMLPGPPRELRPMVTSILLPVLEQLFPNRAIFVCRTFRTTGLGEPLVQERLAEPLRELIETGLEIGYCGRPGQVDIRFAALGAEAEATIAAAEKVTARLLRNYIYASADEELHEAVIGLLSQERKTLALAESCTGGLIAHRLTNVPGASNVLLAGLVTYSNAAKEKFLNVSAETLAKHGAVSEPVAREMAEGARKQTGADYALSVTGIAGPGGGTEAKPVGTVFVSLAGPVGTTVEKYFNPYDRETFKDVTAGQALELLRRTVKGNSRKEEMSQQPEQL